MFQCLPEAEEEEVEAEEGEVGAASPIEEVERLKLVAIDGRVHHPQPC